MGDQINVLVIDDSEDDCLLYRRALQKSTDTNYGLLEARDGETGLSLLEAEPPDCILLDYSLPGRDGLEVLKRIRNIYAYIPVVMLTGQGNEKIAVNAIQLGAQNYIVKSSITQESLEHVIRIAIDHCAMQKRLQEQRSSLEVFTRALVHDLKEPARTIRSFAEMISMQKSLTGKTAEYFTHIQSASERMLDLIDTVFLYTRLEAPGDVIKEICQLSSVLNEAKDNVAQLIMERGASITATTLPDVYANRAQMTQLFQNLICNAINHSETPVRISIRCAARADYWMISVRDDGPGIDPAQLEKIFEPFKRMSRHDLKGFGLGLAISRKIIESLGGRIWCESQPGHGSTFTFTVPRSLPIMEDMPEQAIVFATPESAVAPLINGKQILANILLVDDNQADIELTRYRLLEHSRLQCNLIAATSVREALNMLCDGASNMRPIDMVLLDINMPEIDGFELLQQMHSDESLQNIPVVMCTGSIYDKDMIRAQKLGAAGYLTKPVDFPKLKTIVEQHSKTLRLLQENDGYALWRVA